VRAERKVIKGIIDAPMVVWGFPMWE